MSIDYYILDKDHNVIPAKDVLEWRHFFQKPDRIVAQDIIDNVLVSTIFLGIDHGFGRLDSNKEEPPVTFETMIFGGKHDQYQERCCTWSEAEITHAKAVALVKGED